MIVARLLPSVFLSAGQAKLADGCTVTLARRSLFFLYSWSGGRSRVKGDPISLADVGLAKVPRV